MPTIFLTTVIKAPIEICFDLSRSIDLHVDSVKHTNEKAVAGVISGLIGMNETVTWEARHFGIRWGLTSKITVCERPQHFADTMQRGPFKRFDHDHFFEFKNGKTVMRDTFDYDSPLGMIGRIADILFLKNYMRQLLLTRNRALKEAAESHPEKYLKT